MYSADTIAAVATAPGRAGIGVVRVSGPAVRAVIAGMLDRVLPPRVATLCDFRDANGDTLDRGLALYFPGPESYTGEDVLELHGHGGPAVLQLILRRCLNLGARPAQPGEFTRRAFLNDKLDLAQAESVADLIDASSEAAARGAMRSLAGEFSARIAQLAGEVMELRARVEATLDFPDEEIDFLQRGDAFKRLARLRAALGEIQRAAEQGRILREGARCVLIGQPNVGKSSLLNCLAGDEIAIVTEFPGTTRDPLLHELAIEGVPVHVIDTAGLRDSEEPVEKIGIARAWREIGEADIALLVVDVTRGIAAADRAILARLPNNIKHIFIFNKIDLSGEVASVYERDGRVEVRVSAKSGAGIEMLRASILKAVGWHPAEEAQFMARERHLRALKLADDALARATTQAEAIELFAEELRLAQEALGEITGRVSADDVLGEIFSRFCIGK
ncbi:MAG TPA: tRNA uridine-5-carboxymethylaminomethyl(34) synthesis GTPase MnmE [Burkholderiales bacterium]|nr:tRNA uridine-5-carboxymethylaminomethyl(34) synthesis GTPase MnmE [Burkholderiales bacterium]